MWDNVIDLLRDVVADHAQRVRGDEGVTHVAPAPLVVRIAAVCGAVGTVAIGMALRR
jgi:hypothetical protein